LARYVPEFAAVEEIVAFSIRHGRFIVAGDNRQK
jgi:hypothetical protein